MFLIATLGFFLGIGFVGTVWILREFYQSGRSALDETAESALLAGIENLCARWQEQARRYVADSSSAEREYEMGAHLGQYFGLQQAADDLKNLRKIYKPDSIETLIDETMGVYHE
jgi:beta-phosphoglucomutase-like phosphatase (HAD superfamily)